MPAEREVKVRVSVEVKGLADLQKTEKILDKFGKSISTSSNKATQGARKVGKALGNVSRDVGKTAKTAGKFSAAIGASFNKANTHAKKLGAGVNVVSHDVGETAKVARKFSKDWGVSFKDAHAHVTKLGVGMTTTGKGIKDMGYQLTFIAWHFRYLGNIIS